MNTTETKFESWGLLELFGHHRLAGKITEQAIGGCAFLRIDVPACGARQPFTRYFTQGAIYGLTPMDEPAARLVAERLAAEPPCVWMLPREPAPALEHVAGGGDRDDDIDPDSLF